MAMLPPDPVYIFKGDMKPVSCIAFKITLKEESLYAGTQGGMVHVWSLKSKREVFSKKVSEDVCLSILLSNEGVILTQDKSGHLLFWKEGNNSWILLNEMQIDFFGFCKGLIFEDVAYFALKDSKCQLISMNDAKTLRVVNVSDCTKLGEIMVIKVTRRNDERIILVGYEAQKLTSWLVREETKGGEISLEGCPMALDFDFQTGKGICGDPSHKVLIFSMDLDLKLQALHKISLVNPGVASVRIRDDSKVVAVGCWDGKLRLYSWKTFVLLAVLETHSATIHEVAYTENYKDGIKSKFLLASASQDCKVSLWDLYN